MAHVDITQSVDITSLASPFSDPRPQMVFAISRGWSFSNLILIVFLYNMIIIRFYDSP